MEGTYLVTWRAQTPSHEYYGRTRLTRTSQPLDSERRPTFTKQSARPSRSKNLTLLPHYGGHASPTLRGPVPRRVADTPIQSKQGSSEGRKRRSGPSTASGRALKRLMSARVPDFEPLVWHFIDLSPKPSSCFSRRTGLQIATVIPHSARFP